jgi:hypothetical protein
VATTVALRSTLQCRRPRLSPLSAMNFEMAKLLPVRRVKRFPTKTARECSFPAARLWPERDSSLFSRRKCNGRQPSPTHRWRRLHRARAVTYFGERSFLFAASPGNRRWRRPGSAPGLVEKYCRSRAASAGVRRHPGTGLPPWLSIPVPVPVIAARERLVRAPLLRGAGSHLPPTGRPVLGPPVPAGAAERGTATTNLGTTCS